MTLTKTQIHYLENKLDRVVTEKIAAFKAEVNNNESFSKFVFRNLQAGRVSLLSKKDLMKVIEEQCKGTSYSYYNTTSIAVENMIPTDQEEVLRKEFDDKQNQIDEYSNKLRKAERQALDKIVLEGVDVDSALAELEKI